MSARERKVIEFIILINPLLYGLQDAVENEQDDVIADTVSPAEKVVEKLIALDNRRIDLCNLNVLYGFIERGLGEKFELLRSCVHADIACELYELAVRQIELAGYTVERAEREFEYLMKLVKRKKKKCVLPKQFAGMRLQSAVGK